MRLLIVEIEASTYSVEWANGTNDHCLQNAGAIYAFDNATVYVDGRTANGNTSFVKNSAVISGGKDNINMRRFNAAIVVHREALIKATPVYVMRLVLYICRHLPHRPCYTICHAHALWRNRLVEQDLGTGPVCCRTNGSRTPGISAGLLYQAPIDTVSVVGTACLTDGPRFGGWVWELSYG